MRLPNLEGIAKQAAETLGHMKSIFPEMKGSVKVGGGTPGIRAVFTQEGGALSKQTRFLAQGATAPAGAQVVEFTAREIADLEGFAKGHIKVDPTDTARLKYLEGLTGRVADMAAQVHHPEVTAGLKRLGKNDLRTAGREMQTNLLMHEVDHVAPVYRAPGGIPQPAEGTKLRGLLDMRESTTDAIRSGSVKGRTHQLADAFDAFHAEGDLGMNEMVRRHIAHPTGVVEQVDAGTVHDVTETLAASVLDKLPSQHEGFGSHIAGDMKKYQDAGRVAIKPATPGIV